MVMEFATPDHRHNFTSWALAWSIYVCIGVPLVVWSTVAFWACLWLSLLYFAFHLLIYGLSNGPKTFWHYLTGHSDLPADFDFDLELEKPRSVFDAPRSGRKTPTPRSSRRSSNTSLKDFDPSFTPTPTGPPAPHPLPCDYRSRADSIQVLASNIDGDFGDTGGWATRADDDAALWTAKNTRFDQTAFFSPPGPYDSSAGLGRAAGSPRWSFADSMVRTPLAVVRTPSSHIDPKEDRRRSLAPGGRSGRATPVAGVGGSSSNDGYFPPQMLETSPTAGFDFNGFGGGSSGSSSSFQPRRASMLHKMHRSTTSLDSVPERLDTAEETESDE